MQEMVQTYNYYVWHSRKGWERQGCLPDSSKPELPKRAEIQFYPNCRNENSASVPICRKQISPDIPKPELPTRTSADLPKRIFYPESELPKNIFLIKCDT